MIMTAAACTPVRAPSNGADDFEEATIGDLAARMARGTTTSRALVDWYFERIDSIDRAGPTLRSVLFVDPSARAAADALDRERPLRGPLHGIPIFVKDNIDTANMPTTAGSLALVGNPRSDAAIVERLRRAGAVILGKTNLSEWANIRSYPSTSGWSARGGQTKNPYVLDRNPSGSSSGSAVAVSANLCAAALGTETDGSIVSPASICGIVGIKPTVGLLPSAGIIPISHTQDTGGPMARTVMDAAILLGAMAGRTFDLSAPARGKIGVVRSKAPWVTPALSAVYEEALAALRPMGDLADVELPKPPEDPELDVLLYELNTDLAKYLSTRDDQKLRTLADVIRFNKEHSGDEMPWFGQSLFEKAIGIEAKAYEKGLVDCRASKEALDGALAKVDVLVGPTGGPAWVTDRVNGDNFTGSMSSHPAIAGYPHITVPMGFVHGLPLGLSFIGPANSEEKLLKMAHAFEQATKRRRKPEYFLTI
jgi:amidase